MRTPFFFHSIALVCLVAGFALPAVAQDYKLGTLEIAHPWARPSTGKTGAAYFTVTNTGKTDDALTGVETDAAAKVQIHDMTMDGMVMRMRKVDAVPLPAGQSVEIAPGGLHIMLIGLKAPLKPGDRIPMRLVFKNAGTIAVSVDVETPQASSSGMSGMDNMK